MKNTLITALLVTLVGCNTAHTASAKPLTAPEKGVLCDTYICADQSGVSVDLTRKHLGEAAAQAILSQGEFDVTEFTFATGVFCDTKEKACHVDRYFDANGQRSALDAKHTALLFGN